jgi:hypothetical protein
LSRDCLLQAIHRLLETDAVLSQRRVAAGTTSDGPLVPQPAEVPPVDDDVELDVPVSVSVGGTRVPVIKLVGTLRYLRKQQKNATSLASVLKPEPMQSPVDVLVPAPAPAADKPVIDGDGGEEPPFVHASPKKRKPRVKQQFPAVAVEAEVPGGAGGGRTGRFSDFSQPYVVVWTTTEDARLLSAIDSAAEAPLFEKVGATLCVCVVVGAASMIAGRVFQMETLVSFDLDGVQWDAVRDATFLVCGGCLNTPASLRSTIVPSCCCCLRIAAHRCVPRSSDTTDEQCARGRSVGTVHVHAAQVAREEKGQAPSVWCHSCYDWRATVVVRSQHLPGIHAVWSKRR